MHGVYAHRLAWAIEHGPPARSVEVLHTCGDITCCNPRHLREGTGAELVRRFGLRSAAWANAVIRGAGWGDVEVSRIPRQPKGGPRAGRDEPCTP